MSDSPYHRLDPLAALSRYSDSLQSMAAWFIDRPQPLDDRIIIEQPIANRMQPGDDAILRDLGILPPATNFAEPRLEFLGTRFVIDEES